MDDTEQLNRSYVGIGGIIFHDNCLNDFSSMFSQKKEFHGIPSEEEIKWSPSKSSWIAKNLVNDKRISAYSDILGLIKLFNGKVIVAVMKISASDPGRLTEAKWKCIEFVTERFQFYLQAHEDKKGILIADFPGSGKEERELLQKYHRLLERGTNYVKPANIVMNLLTTESHLNPAIQVADLVVGITTGMCTPKQDYARPYWEIVKPNLHRSKNGEVIGCGLKIFPKEIVQEIHMTLFPEEIDDNEESVESYEEYVERMRSIYSVLMTEDELDMHFPRP